MSPQSACEMAEAAWALSVSAQSSPRTDPLVPVLPDTLASAASSPPSPLRAERAAAWLRLAAHEFRMKCEFPAPASEDTSKTSTAASGTAAPYVHMHACREDDGIVSALERRNRELEEQLAELREVSRTYGHACASESVFMSSKLRAPRAIGPDREARVRPPTVAVPSTPEVARTVRPDLVSISRKLDIAMRLILGAKSELDTLMTSSAQE
jgi:hypothetical protein